MCLLTPLVIICDVEVWICWLRCAGNLGVQDDSIFCILPAVYYYYTCAATQTFAGAASKFLIPWVSEDRPLPEE